MIKKKSLWRKRHELNGDIIYKNCANKCKTSIEKFHVREETALLRVKRKTFFILLSNKLRSRAKLSHMQGLNDTLKTDPSEIANGFLN